MANSVGADQIDLTAFASTPRLTALLPVLCLGALASAALIYVLVGQPALAAGLGVGLIAAGVVAWCFRRLFPRAVVEAEAAPDWSVARAAADAAGMAMAVTDRAGRLMCASDRFGEWFAGYPTPPGLPLDAAQAAALSAAGRAAWRDGEAGADIVLAQGEGEGRALRVEIARAGRADDYLLWRFQPKAEPAAIEDLSRMVAGPVGRQFSDAAVMAVFIGAEGRIRAANPAFLIRATGRDDGSLAGRDFAALMRLDDKGRLFFAREERDAMPVRLLQVPTGAGVDAPSLLLLIDETPSAGENGSSLAYIEKLLSLLPFGLAMADRDGRILFLNEAFARAAGVRPGDRPSYPSDLVTREDAGAVADAVRRFGVGQQISGDIAIRLRNQPDEPVALSLAGVRGLGDAAVLLSLKDNSEESKLKRQVAQATKMQAIGQLAGGVAHDFNNILTAIIGHCDLILMRHTPGDSDYDDILQIKSNSNRAASLTRQLLAFSRQQTLRPQVLQLPDVVSEVSNLLKRLLGETVKLHVQHGRGLGPVRADPGQLEQVIMNLAVNARDSMLEKGGGAGTLTIQTYNVPAAKVREMDSDILPIGDYTALRVSDTGSGISPENLSKIFEPFFTTKEVGKGTGLGLSTVYGIVKQSGGFIFAESEPGQGASFVIYLPVHSAPEPVVTRKVQPKRSETWGSGTILLVEDEDMVRTVAERALTRQGYTVLTASDGEQGLEALAAADQVDLMISDVVMPNMDGPTMVAKARQAHPDLPVLFMSGYAEEQLRKSIDIANVAFLPKPFSVTQLAEAARDALAAARESV